MDKRDHSPDQVNFVSIIGRRSFLTWCASLFGGTLLGGTLMSCSSFPRKKEIPLTAFRKSPADREKLIYIAIDALHPKYLDLNAKGLSGGKEGDWLMPNICAFLKDSLWYRDAKAYLPAATDMNHLNAMAGTSTAQTGIIGVWAQPSSWDEKGEVVITHSALSFAKDEQGRPVDTIFHAWKRRWPNSKTLLITGKEWVGEMFSGEKPGTCVDILVTGLNHPEYLEPPKRESFADPETDVDAACDPESGHLGWFSGNMRPSRVSTRMCTGQGSMVTTTMEFLASHFPHDRWIVDSTLEIFRREDPELAYILLAQCDDAGHCIGNAPEPSEFADVNPPYKPPAGCVNRPEYQLVSKRNRLLYKEAILDPVRDVDIQFGRLIEGLRKQGSLDKARVILLSDHAAVNHIATDDFTSTDVMNILKDAGFVYKKNVYAFSVSSYGNLYWRDHKEKVPEAKKLLEAHTAVNPETGERECPWWIIDRDGMKNGVDGVCLPGELYHRYYVDTDREKTMIWPDLIILARNGWQIPAYNGHVPNVGIKTPKWAWPWRVYNGGHGSVDTLPIVAAISVPKGKTGESSRQIRIADLGVTAASLFGLKLNSSTVGKDLSPDLV